ncbi:sigma factor-like helix-turn-helix DNA-binding protein [Rhodococcus tibetensis]|uniref:RNA polymerase subunit sigma-70 n=1 Tax=Rhodococcus tibetensis TaxID=2965064 RepID=A0ABT1QHT8_9NOCA|nr:sigma factor-like helix-turn-helix DNA-binding protein [Rhodococcus sp. FXJ9.536]MCQ4121851.1 RNA polymerase subunit sigma-70 [Rhodococcus sp. FXJ9.536]
MTIDDKSATRPSPLVDALPGRYRTVLRLRLAHQLSVEQVARMLGTSTEAVLLTQHAAMNLLRRELADERHSRSERRMW